MPIQQTRQLLSSTWFDRFARFGYAAKGTVFALVGLLALRVAWGDRNEQADFGGALAEVGDQPFQAVLLVVIGLGLTGYGLWRIIQGLADLDDDGSSAMGWARRLVFVGIGIWYGVFAVYAFGVLGGWSMDDEGEVRDLAAMALGWPAGRWIVGIAGVVVIVYGLVEIFFAVTRRFEVELGSDEFSAFERVCLLCAGGFGHFMRGIVFGAAGIFGVRAAINYDPDEARGLAETFRELADQPGGLWLATAAGAGFVAFGIYCVLLAFHRHIPNESIGNEGGDGDRRQEAA